MAKTIHLGAGLTWRAALDAILLPVLEGGDAEGKEQAKKELRDMAHTADTLGSMMQAIRARIDGVYDNEHLKKWMDSPLSVNATFDVELIILKALTLIA